MLIGPVGKLLMGAHKYADHDYQHLTPLAQCIFKVFQDEGHKLNSITPMYYFFMKKISWITFPILIVLSIEFFQKEMGFIWFLYFLSCYVKGPVHVYDTQFSVDTFNLWVENPKPLDITNLSFIVESHPFIYAIPNNNIQVPAYNLHLMGIGLFFFISSGTIAYKKRWAPACCLMALGSLSIMVYALGCMLTTKTVDPEAFKISLNDKLLKCK